MTPMLAQYRQIKARFPDAVILFRLGDFYETFENDAKTAARELELVLTSRSFSKDVRLPMAGVPHHHVQSYIAKLIDRGYKVALVEQLEDPKKVKRLVKRDVIRVITPGTVVEDVLLRAKSENYLAAIVRDAPLPRAAERSVAAAYGLALVDLSTGEFAATQIEGADADARLFDELSRVEASEYVLPPGLLDDEGFTARVKAIRPARLSPIEEQACQVDAARRALNEHLHVATLDAFGCERLPLAVAAAGAVLQYLKRNQPGGENASALLHLNYLWTFSLSDTMTLDAATRRNLELTASLHAYADGRSPHNLLGILDQTVTAMGARLLKRWVQQPLLDVAQINARLNAVQVLVRDAFLREDLRKLLDGLYDVERLVGRIGFGNANARDLIALKRTLARLPQIKARLRQSYSSPQPPSSPVSGGEEDLLHTLEHNLDELRDVAELIDRALVDDPPIFIREGGLIKRDYDPALEELRTSAASGNQWLAELEEQERQRTGIKNLRVRYNEVFGFFIEVPRSAARLIPPDYERRATITHAERYVTPELKTQEAHILATQDRIKDLEYDLFVQVRSEVARHSARLQSAARILAQLDALGALAQVAALYHYTKPVVDDGDAIEIREGRHPVVERFLPEGESFVPNDVRLDHEAQRVLILTGPNMSGKSVFVRQVALIVLMAHVGSFVPATSAHVGLTDRIFTRAGASDDIAQGRSTFLVEMSETSHILRHATPRSLIVLDEVGRGTSTYDGISLAWAIAEEIHNVVGAKTLFATHYHELTRLAEVLGAAVKNYTMAVHERGSEVVFLRQVIAGSAEKSFGIHVARLAGLPSRVIERSEQVLQGLEESRGTDEATRASGQGDTRQRTGGQGDKETGAVEERGLVREERDVYDTRIEVWRSMLKQLMAVDIANITPLQALNLLNEMQVMVKGK